MSDFPACEDYYGPALTADCNRAEPARGPGYHLRPIQKGVVGEISKIVEEAEEFAEALEQGVVLMALVELADLIGAMDAYIAKKFPCSGYTHDCFTEPNVTFIVDAAEGILHAVNAFVADHQNDFDHLLSNIVYAIETYLSRHHPSICVSDLASMAAVTRRAFENGRR